MSASAGALDGRTIFRFAHAFDSGGGTETYLADLDRALLERNAATIIRLHLTREPSPRPRREQQLGRGRLVTLALPIRPAPATSGRGSGGRERLRRWFRDFALYPAPCWILWGARYTRRKRLSPRPGEAIGAGEATAAILGREPVDLAILHFFGGQDADEVLTELRRRRIPTGLLNHYANDRFLHLPIRKHAMLADAVAGVNGLDLPRYLRGRFVNVSDGVDVTFYRREHAARLADAPAAPAVLLPARLIREKGQLDLIAAAGRLRREGLRCALVFAGRTDDEIFVREVRAALDREGLAGDARLLGPIDARTLRDWYAAAAVLALPTYHHEGLPRIVLEAQAMGVPVVAYATGGVADGIEEDRTGYTVRTGDCAALTARLGRILRDETERARLGTGGRAAAEARFSLEALRERHERFYLGLMGARA